MKTAAILLRSPRAFPLSVWATFMREIQIVTHKFTQLSTYARDMVGTSRIDMRYTRYTSEYTSDRILLVPGTDICRMILQKGSSSHSTAN